MEEFFVAMLAVHEQMVYERELMNSIEELWSSLDRDRSGALESDEIWRAVKKGVFDELPGFENKKAMQVMRILDLDNNGLVDREEFYGIQHVLLCLKYMFYSIDRSLNTNACIRNV